MASGAICIIAIFSDGWINLQDMSLTAAMITMAVFGTIMMYIISILSLFRLRRQSWSAGRVRQGGVNSDPAFRSGNMSVKR